MAIDSTAPVYPPFILQFGILVTVYVSDSTLRTEVWRALDNGSGAPDDTHAVLVDVLQPSPIGGVTFIDPLPNDGLKRYYKSRHFDEVGNLSLFTAYSSALIPEQLQLTGAAPNPMAAFGAIVDQAPPSTLYEIRLSPAYPDPDQTDGIQSHIDFPATTNFMRVGQTPLAISSSTNASPISVHVVGHGYSTGDHITIHGHLVNTAANNSTINPSWTITVTGNDDFTLNGSTGNGTGINTGHAVKLSLTVAPNGALMVFAIGTFTILNAISATITGLFSALGGMLVRNTLQHSVTGNYGDTTVNRVLLENNSFKLMGDVGTGHNNESVRIGDFTTGTGTPRSTTNLNDPASGSRGWTDPETSPAAVTITYVASAIFTVPQDWNNANNSITAVGAGGDGAPGTLNNHAGGGGGGGEMRVVSNVSLTPGSTVSMTLGPNLTTTVGATIVQAVKGASASGVTGGAGGTGGVGGTGFAGGSGGNGASGTLNRGGGGGGGAGGSSAVGSNGGSGSSSTGGNGGAGGASGGGSGGTDGQPGNNGGSGSPNGGGGGGEDGGTAQSGGNGGSNGGGGGGGNSSQFDAGSGGTGSGGFVQITYTPVGDNGINLISRAANGSSAVAAANRLWQKLGDSTEGANIPSGDGNYVATFKLFVDATQWALTDTGTATATVTAEYSTDAAFATWTALTGSWSVTYTGNLGNSQLPSQVFSPTLVVPGSPAHVGFRFTVAIAISGGPGKTASAVLKCFATTYKTDNYAATWFSGAGSIARRGTKVFASIVPDKLLLEDSSGFYLLEDGSGAIQLETGTRAQPHASWSPVSSVGTDLTEGELQFVGGNVHGPAYADDETVATGVVRYLWRVLGVETNKTTAAASDTKITTGIKIAVDRLSAVNRTLRIRAGGSIGANTGTVNLRLGSTNATPPASDGAIATLSLASGEKWVFDVTMTITATGAGGTARVSGITVHGTTIALVSGTFAIDTTVAEFVNVTGLTAGAVTLTVDEDLVEHVTI